MGFICPLKSCCSYSPKGLYFPRVATIMYLGILISCITYYTHWTRSLLFSFENASGAKCVKMCFENHNWWFYGFASHNIVFPYTLCAWDYYEVFILTWKAAGFFQTISFCLLQSSIIPSVCAYKMQTYWFIVQMKKFVKLKNTHCRS